MSYTASPHHIVFSTYKRERTLRPEFFNDLFNYIWGITKRLNCHLIRINGMTDHIHILVDLHPDISLSKYVGTIKQSTNIWIKESKQHPMFYKWEKEYFGVCVSPENKQNVVQYIRNQQMHHLNCSSADELKQLVEKAGLKWYISDK